MEEKLFTGVNQSQLTVDKPPAAAVDKKPASELVKVSEEVNSSFPEFHATMSGPPRLTRRRSFVNCLLSTVNCLQAMSQFRGAMSDTLTNSLNGPLSTAYCQLSTDYTIFSGLTHSSNCSEVTSPSSTAASRSVLFSLCAFFAIFAAFS
jgi:hypothetical protein